MADLDAQASTKTAGPQRKTDMGSRRFVMFRAKRKVSARMRPRVSEKIRTLVAEGMPHKQAVAVALNMARAGRLGPKGGYRRVKR